MLVVSLKKAENRWLRDFVRKEPPLMLAVNPSARRRSGNIAHSEYRPIMSRKLGLVVRRMPNSRERILLIIARVMPLRTMRRKKSIRKKSTAPSMVLSVSATKYLKNIG